MTTENIISKIIARASEFGLPYFGAATPSETQALLSSDQPAFLVDVRTKAEWNFVGVIPGSLQIEWQTYPTGQLNQEFLTSLEQSVGENAFTFFICRSGARSHSAASLAANNGYGKSINVLDGFEGDKDKYGHRGTVGGWKFSGLPWVQG